MAIYYSSTRGGEKNVTASQAILKGLAEDGGLFMPDTIPVFDRSFSELAKMSYQEVAYEVMKLFLSDFTEEELKDCIARAYDSKFDTEEIAPLVKADGAYYLELFHGNTIAFKDMALSILPRFMTAAARKNKIDNTIVILTATSGDTGKAAMAGFADVEGTKIIVFYPKDGVSRVQELQMLTQKGDNTSGLPVGRLICASNDNKVLYDFFRTGIYDRKREFILTSSPSMDILISSNLERLIYLSTGCDAAKTRELMEELTRDGKYTVTDDMRERMADFSGGYATQEENAAEIKRLFDDTGYMIDTHTGVASCVYRKYVKETNDTAKTVIASTASPYKFSRSVMEAIYGSEEGKDEFELIDEMEKASGVAVPAAIEEIRNAEIRHNIQCTPDTMESTVADILK